ncbi:MAG: hypothetical protein PF503_08855, partial [Desulfobacula sp.]|nr:hypothetical protein [Desulfobacula sp.]
SIEKKKNVKNLIDSIYKWRNMFVHGEMPVPHPLIDDIGEPISKMQIEYFKVLDNGYQLVVSTLQKMIINNANNICFEEFFKHKKLNPS